MMRSRKYSWTRKLFFASFLVVCTSADPLRWLSRRDFVYDTTGQSNNMQTEAEGIELEFGQQRDLRIVHRKDNTSEKRNNEKEVKRKRKLKKVYASNHHDHHSHNNQEHRHNNNRNHLRGKHGDYYNRNKQHGNGQEHFHHLEDDININIDADFMGHILRRKKEPKSLDYQDGKHKNPTPQPTNRPSKRPTKRPSKQPTIMPFSDTSSSYPTASATKFPVANVGDEINEECSPNSICNQEGTFCSSGQEECCGVTHASLECECMDIGSGALEYMCFHTDACMLPCEDDNAIDTSSPTPAPTRGKTSSNTWAPTGGIISSSTLEPTIRTSTLEPTTRTSTLEPTIATTSNSTQSKPSAILCPTNLSQSESLLDDLTLNYEVKGDNLCMRLEYDNEGWIGLGFSSPDGRMVGSTAVIGLPDVKEAKYYALDGMSETMVTLLPESQQTLQEATIMQEDGLTMLSFAISLIDDEYVSVGENTFIFAAANSNQFGYHDKRGAITLNL